MLTRSKLTSFEIPDVDLDSFARSAGDLATQDLPRLVRRADVPRRLEEGLDLAADALHAAAGQIPGRHRRSRLRPLAPALVIVGILALIGVTGWWMARSNAIATTREMDRELDREALDRATSEGMANDGFGRPETSGDGFDRSETAQV